MNFITIDKIVSIFKEEHFPNSGERPYVFFGGWMHLIFIADVDYFIIFEMYDSQFVKISNLIMHKLFFGF